ncbi:MAG: oligosaccharide flippase family protein [Christensenellaceae bacterium]|nr:oligosaccharide flippase family protein [Christensenellaceae bacterium]
MIMKQKTDFAGRFLLLCSSNIILQCIGFLYRILLSRYAGAEGLGVYRLASSVYALLHATCLSGVTLACTRFASKWKAEKRDGAISSLVHWIFLIFGGLFVVSGSCVWFGRAYISDVLIGDPRVRLSIPIMLICLLLTSIENIFKSIMIGSERVDNAVISELTEQTVRIFAAIVLLELYRTEDVGRTAALIFCASVISEIFSAAIMTGMYLSMLRSIRTLPPKGFRKDVCKTVFPVSAAALCNNLIAAAGSVLLPKRLTSTGISSHSAIAELGMITGVAAPIITLPMALITSLCTVTLPEVSARSHRPQEMPAFAEKVFRTLGLIAIPFTALLLPLAPVISRLFFYQAVDQGIFLLMGLSCILCYYQIMTSCFLNGCGQQGRNACIVTCGEILQLILVWILTGIPKLRIYGYISAQCIAPLLVSIVNFILLRRCDIVFFKIKTFLLEPTVCGILMFLWSRIFFSFYTGIMGQWHALFMTLLSSVIFYLILLRLLDIELSKYMSNIVRSHSFHPMFY